MHGKDEKCIQNFGWEKSGGKRPLGRPSCRWEDIQINLQIGWEGVDWMHLVQDRNQSNNDPSVSIKGGEFLD
jgi:hypothetical protein